MLEINAITYAIATDVRNAMPLILLITDPHSIMTLP
jgi:hypothetical protein